MSATATPSSDKSTPTDVNAGVAGAVRHSIRSLFPGITIHRPMFRPPKIPIKERTAVLHSVIEAAHHQAVSVHPEKSKSGWRAKFAKLPNHIRPGVLGFVTWTSYDIGYQLMAGRDDDKSVIKRFGIALLAGGFAGGLHGALWSKSEKWLTRFTPQCLPSHTLGMMISHGGSHMAMFSSYEGTRAFMINRYDMEPMIATVIAGSISGVVVDVVSHFAAPFEHFSFKIAAKQLKLVRFPSVKEMGASAGATLLGWIAYESAKEQMEAQADL